MINVDEHSSGGKISLPVGDTLEISLAENPTTGFRWHLQSEAQPACKLVKSSFEPATGATGRGGIHRWQFQAVRAGIGKIRIEYRRPWEQDSPPGRTFILSVHVLEKNRSPEL
jgi:inhibitor of cysteine peptidase